MGTGIISELMRIIQQSKNLEDFRTRIELSGIALKLKGCNELWAYHEEQEVKIDDDISRYPFISTLDIFEE